jgi:hypothetical protein
MEQTGAEAPPEIYTCLENTISTSLQEEDPAFDISRFHKEWVNRLTSKPLPNRERHALITTLKNSTNATTIELGHMTAKELPAIPEYDPERPAMDAEEANHPFQASQEEIKGIQGKVPPVEDMLDYIRTLEKVDLSKEAAREGQEVIKNPALQNATIKSLRMVSAKITPIIIAILAITTTTAQDRTAHTDTQLRQAGEQITIEGLHIRMALDTNQNLLIGATSSTKMLHITHMEHEFRFTEAGRAETQLNNLIANTSEAHNTHTGTEFPEIRTPIGPATTLKEACDCHLTDATKLETVDHKDSRSPQTESTDKWVYNHTEHTQDTCLRSKRQEQYEVTTGENNTCTINPTPLNKATSIRQYANMTIQQMNRHHKPCIARGHYNINQLVPNKTQKTSTQTLLECMVTCHFTQNCTVWMYNTAATTCWMLSLEMAHTFTTTQDGATYAGPKECIPCEIAPHLTTPPNCTLEWNGRPQTKIRCPCITKGTLRRNMDALKIIKGKQQRNSITTNHQTTNRKQSLGRALNKILAQATKQTIHTLHQMLTGQQKERPGANIHHWDKEPLISLGHSLTEYLSPAKITSIVQIGAKELCRLWKDSPQQNLRTKLTGEVTEYTAKHNFTPLTSEGQITNTELERDATALAKFVADSDIQKKRITHLTTLPNQLKPFYATQMPQGAQAILITSDTGDTVTKIALIPTMTDERLTEIAIIAIPTEIGADHREHPTATGIRQLTPDSTNHRPTASNRWQQTTDSIETCFSQMAAGVENPTNCDTQDTPQPLRTTTILSIRTKMGPKRLIRLCHTKPQEITVRIKCGEHTNIEHNKGVMILLIGQACRISSHTGKPIANQMTESPGHGHTYHLLYNEELKIGEDWQGPDETTASILGVLITICLGMLADKIRNKCKHRCQKANTEPNAPRANTEPSTPRAHSTDSLNAERRSPTEWQPLEQGSTMI